MTLASVKPGPESSPVTRPSLITNTRSQIPISSGNSEEITITPTPFVGKPAQDAVNLGLCSHVDTAGRLIK